MTERSGSGRARTLFWLVLTVSVAAAIPVVVYLTLTRDRDGSRLERERPEATTPAGDLHRLAGQEPLYRDSVTVQLGDRKLFEAVELRKDPGESTAVARSMRLHLPLLFSARKGALDDGFTELFEALPPGTTTVATQRLHVQLGSREGEAGLERECRGSLSLEEQSVRVAAEWTEREQSCSGEVIYTLHQGLLFVRYDCPGSRFPAAFLGAGTELRLDGLTITSGSYLEVRNPAVAQEADERVIFRADRLVFSAPRAVSRMLFANGLPTAGLARERQWKLELEAVTAALERIDAIPFFGSFQGLPAATIEAGSLTLDSAGSVAFEKPRFVWPKVGRLEAASLHFATDGTVQHFEIKAPSFEEGKRGIIVRAPTVQVERDAYRTYRITVESFEVGPPVNPLRLAALMKEAAALKEQLKGLRSATLELPPLQVPAGIPDLRLRASGGTVALPLPGGAKITDMAVTVDVKGGSVERAEAGLCMGSEKCEQLSAKGGLRTDSVGRVETLALELSGTRAAALVRERAPETVQGLRDLAVACNLRADGGEGAYLADCTATLTDLKVFHKRLALEPITVPHLRVEGEARLDTRRHSLELSLPKVQLGEVYFRVALDLNSYDGLPAVKLTVDMPEQSCAALLRSVPVGFAPHLGKARLTGSIWFRVDFNVDLKDVRKSIKLEVDGDLDRCDATTLGPGFDVTELNRDDYVHRVVVGDEDLGIDVGPGTDTYVPLNQVPKVVQAAAYGTEDLAFFRHNGFRTGLIRRAIILFLERGYYAYGGSTISQQLVKNLYLSRTKSLSRKFEEAVIVWKMEKEVSKERIFELYLNCIEYGPKIWGISKASRTYFGKHPTQLNAMEAAFLMGLKPDPQYGYLQYRRGGLNKHWRQNLNRVLKRLLDMGAIPYETYDQAMRSRLRFRNATAVQGEPDEDRPVRTGQEELDEL